MTCFLELYPFLDSLLEKAFKKVAPIVIFFPSAGQWSTWHSYFRVKIVLCWDGNFSENIFNKPSDLFEPLIFYGSRN